MIFFLTGTRRAELRTIWFDPLQASMVRSASRLSGYIRARVGKRANYTVRQSTSTERIVGTSSFEGTSADISTTTTGSIFIFFRFFTSFLAIEFFKKSAAWRKAQEDFIKKVEAAFFRYLQMFRSHNCQVFRSKCFASTKTFSVMLRKKWLRDSQKKVDRFKQSSWHIRKKLLIKS